MSIQNETPMESHSVMLDQKSGLSGLFGPHSLDAQDDKGLLHLIEASLYALFASFITIMLLLPSQANNIQAMFPNTPLTDPVGFVIWIKMTLFIASLVPLFWGLHLSSKRLKGRLLLRKSL